MTDGEEPGADPWRPAVPPAGPTDPWQLPGGAAPPPPGPPPLYGPPPTYGPPPYGQAPYGQAPYGQAPYGQAPYGQAPYGQAPYGQAPYGYPLPHQQRGTNGLAVASLVCGILWLFWIGSVLAVVFGVIALGQIRARGEGGRGLAIAGIVLGALGGVLLVLAIIGAAVDSGTSTYSLGALR